MARTVTYQGQELSVPDARRVVIEHIGALPPDVADLARQLLPVAPAREARGPAKVRRFLELLKVGPVTVADLATMGWSKTDAVAASWYWRKRKDPSTRAWIRFEADAFHLVATGGTPPEGWVERTRHRPIGPRAE